MPAGINTTEAAAMTSLRTFLLAVLGPIPIVQGQVNRVASPTQPDYVVMTPIIRTRMATNQESYAEASFEGSIAGEVLTITVLLEGNPAPGQALSGDGLAPGSMLAAPTGGPPGAETWSITPSQTVAPGLIFAGGLAMEASTLLTVQVDVFGPRSGDLAQIATTTLRSGFACDAFGSYGLGVTPCYTSDPRQMPFWTGEKQSENRWSLDAVLQVNPIVTVPQQFAGEAVVGLIEIDTVYPPGAAP